MRISLVEREPQNNRKRKRRKKQRRLRTFDSAIARPQALPGARVKKRRTAAKKAPTKRRVRSKPLAAPVASTTKAESWWRTALARLLAVGAILGAIAMVTYGSADARFFVYDAQVTGANHVDPAIIYRQAAVHEQNIFWIRPDRVEERIRQIDGVKAARVRVGLPARVSIQVQEREPVVMWRALSQQRDWWLDEEGRVLPYPGDPGSENMIFVVDSSERQLTQGESLQPAGLVRSVEQLAAAVPGTQIFFYDADRELSFTQQGSEAQWPVYVGTSDDLPRKIQVLQVIDRYLKDNGIHPRYVDVRWPDHPIYSAPGGDTTGESE